MKVRTSAAGGRKSYATELNAEPTKPNGRKLLAGGLPLLPSDLECDGHHGCMCVLGEGGGVSEVGGKGMLHRGA